MKVGFLTLLMSLGVPTWGQSLPPVSGLLHNTKEDSALTYQCRKSARGDLDCEFNQTAVRRKLSASDVVKEREQGLQDIRSASKEEIQGSCDDAKRSSAVLQGKASKDEMDQARRLTEAERRDILEQLRLFERFCSDRSEASWMAIIERDISKRLKTCTVSSNSFKQTFRLVADPSSGQSTWVVRAEPDGPCGLVQLSRFEFERRDKEFGFWVYHARKAVTNPKAESFPGVRCGDLDQEEYVYDWRSREHPVGCDYIEFSVL